MSGQRMVSVAGYVVFTWGVSAVGAMPAQKGLRKGNCVVGAVNRRRSAQWVPAWGVRHVSFCGRWGVKRRNRKR